MSFVNPTYLFALAGALLPVAIHLLTRDRIRKVEFSTLRFFVKASGRVLRRKRFREMVLLAMRSLVCALLAMAFARPLFGVERPDDGGAAVVHARTARVILADVSASMGRGDGGEKLVEAAKKALEELDAGTDAAGVVAFADAARIRAPLAKGFDRVLEAVETLEPGEGGTDIPRALRRADRHLQRAIAEKRQIVLLSDLQRTGWQTPGETTPLTAGTELVIRPIAPTGGTAAAVRAVSFPQTTVLDREPRAIRAQVHNYSAEAVEGLEVAFTLGGQTRTRTLNLRPGGTATATVRHVFTEAGDNPGTIALPDGRTTYFNTRVMPKIAVRILDGATGGRMSEAAFFVQAALAPGEGLPVPFDVKTLPAAEAGPADVADARVVILVNVPTVPMAMRKALADLLAAGGGLFWMPGDRVTPESFAGAFDDLAPCNLRRVRSAKRFGAAAAGASLAQIEYQHPIFEVFSHPRHGDLSLPKFARYWEVTDSQLSQVLARFDDNRPAVVARRMGKGISLLLASCPKPTWTDLPRRTTFLPLMWQTVRYLAARTEGRTAYRVGEALPVPEGLELVRPDGKPAGPGGGIARRSGFYELKDADGETVLTYAVNRDPAEADPAPVAAEEILAAVQRPDAADGAARTGRNAPPAEQHDDRGLWRWLILAVALLLTAELLLGNNTLRH